MSERSDRLVKAWAMRRPRLDRVFWTQTVISETGCWLWTGTRQGRGYGFVIRNRRRFLAHRYAFVLVNGPIPDGLQVLHRCDVRLCVNPAHLFVGTQGDNMQDMASKGRGRNQYTVARLQIGEAEPWSESEMRIAAGNR